MSDEQQRGEPLTKLGQSAAQLHEAYWSFVHAGFTERQALYLTAALACRHAGPPPKGTDDG